MSNADNHITPPRLAQRLLNWFLKEELIEEVLGDLDEKFMSTVDKKSVGIAKLNYWFQTLNYLRPFALKRKQSAQGMGTNRAAMLKHNLLISFRSFKRYKSTFLINLFGLATGLASALLIYLWVNDELNTNHFAEADSERHVQIFVNSDLSAGIYTNEITPMPLAKALEEELPEVEKGISIIEDTYYKGVLSFDEIFLRAIPKFVGNGYFDVFSCDFVAGSKPGALDNRNVVISTKLANGLFNGADEAIGKTVNFNGDYYNGPYVVSGVFEPGYGTTQPFNILLSFDQFLNWRPENNNWGNGGTQTHLVLKEGVALDPFNAKINGLLSKFMSSKQTLFAQQYSDTYLYGKYENGVPVAGRIIYVRIFSIIALFILAIACINYMNLSTAQASRRIKEIGVKKAIGAHRKALIHQFFGESMFMSLFSLLLAIVIVTFLLPKFNEITGKALSINATVGIAIPILLTTLLTGFVSGIYPGLYLSGFKPVLALKGKIKSDAGGFLLRKGLVVFQFVISITLIISVITIYRQIDFIQTSNLGYKTDHLISFRQEGDLIEDNTAFITEAKKIPGIQSISHMWGDIGGDISGAYNVKWKDQDPGTRRIEFHFIEGGYDLASLMGVELIAGRFISKDYSTDDLSIVINETAARLIGFENPIGEKISRGDDYTIVGVVKDFHFKGMQEEIQPFFFMPWPTGDTFVARIEAQNRSETINRIEELYTTFNPQYPFEFKFVDSNYQKLYEEEERIANLSKHFSIIAIAISCLGLLALTAFSTQRRFKEIAIRKVLGSGAFEIVRLLSQEFIILVVVAITISLPIGYYLMNSWLNGFAYRIGLEPLYFLIAGVLMLLIAWLTIIAQTAKSANINVTESLRSE